MCTCNHTWRYKKNLTRYPAGSCVKHAILQQKVGSGSTADGRKHTYQPIATLDTDTALNSPLRQTAGVKSDQTTSDDPLTTSGTGKVADRHPAHGDSSAKKQSALATPTLDYLKSPGSSVAKKLWIATHGKPASLSYIFELRSLTKLQPFSSRYLFDEQVDFRQSTRSLEASCYFGNYCGSP